MRDFGSFHPISRPAREQVGFLPLRKIIAVPGRQIVVKRLATDRLRSLGWKPEVELEEGMREVYEWVQRFDANGAFLEERAAA